MPPLIIDCHAHVYGEDDKKYPPVDKPVRPPKGTGTVPHFRRQMNAAGVRYVTFVQPRTFYSFDNRFLLDTVREHKGWAAGVCTLDPDDPHSPGLLEQYVRTGTIRGLRSVPTAKGRLEDPGVVKLWERAGQLGIVVNAFIGREQAKELAALLPRFPKLPVVLDHCLELKAGPDLDKTLADVVRLARHPNLYAKLTFIPTGSAEKYPCRDMHEPCKQIIQAFGPRRCVWGSDFPCELWCPNVTYAQHLKIFTQELGLDAPTQEAVLGTTARGLWFARRK